MELAPIGRLEDPSVLDVDEDEMLTIPIVGYTEPRLDEDGKRTPRREVETRIRFVPSVPAGATVGLTRAMNDKGDIVGGAAVRYLDRCVYFEDREKWDAIFADPDLFVEQSTLVAVYKALEEFYGGRPTRRSSGSRRGPSPTKRTSGGAAPARKSSSKN